MNDDDINKLAAKLTQSLVTKEEFTKGMDEIKNEIKSVGDTLSEYTHGLDDKVENHEKRIIKIESLPTIAHQIK